MTQRNGSDTQAKIDRNLKVIGRNLIIIALLVVAIIVLNVLRILGAIG